MTPQEAARDAQAGKLLPLYLVLGEERYLQKQVIDALTQAALAGGVPGLNDDQLLAQEASVSQSLQIARTLPMMSKRRLVRVQQIEHWEGKGDTKRATSDFDELARYAEDPMPSTVLILSGSSLNARRKVVKLAKKQGFLVQCDPLSPRDLPPWIQAEAERAGAKISRSTAELLGEIAGPELSPLCDAIERLALYTNGAEIDEAALGECISSVKTKTVWELVAAMGRRDVGGALAALSDVYDPRDRGLRLLGLLAWSTRQLLRFRTAIDDGAAAEEAAKRAGVPPFKARDLQQQVRRLPAAQLEQWLPVLAQVDLSLKGGSKRPPQAILEEALIKLCTGH